MVDSDSDQELVDAETPEEARQREEEEKQRKEDRDKRTAEEAEREREEQRRLEEEREAERRRIEEEREAERRRLEELEREIEERDREEEEEEEEEIVIPIPGPIEPAAMAATAGFGDSIQIRDLPKFSGEDKENPVQFKQAFNSLLPIYRINLTAAEDALPDHLRTAVQTLKLCLKGKALAWWLDNYGTAAIGDKDAFDAMLKALILQFHPLGKTQEEWEKAWDIINRREYPSLMAFTDKVKEIQKLTGKTEAAALAKVKRYASITEFQIIKDDGVL